MPSSGPLPVASWEGHEVFSIPCLQVSSQSIRRILARALPSSTPFQLATWEMIRGTAIEVPCGAALHLLSSFTAHSIPRNKVWNLASSLISATSSPPSLVDHSDAASWRLMSSLIRQTEDALLAALNAVPRSDKHFGYLAGCASRVLANTRPQLSDVPMHLRRLGDPHTHADAQSLPFSRRSTPVATVRLAKPSQQFPTSYRPQSYSDILEPSALDAIQAWLQVEHSNMVAISNFGPSVKRVRDARKKLGFGQAIDPHETLVIGQDQFLEQARGIIWDCRGFVEGLPAIPMDFSAAPNSDLNNAFIFESLSLWPDQELVGFLYDGVQFQANLPLQIVLGPHLSSLSAAWDSVNSEILRLEGLNYYDIIHALPSIPIRSVPQGSTPRKLEPDRHRRTSDGGCPRKDVCDRAGVPAVSLNAAIGLHSTVDLDVDPTELSAGDDRTGNSQGTRRKWPAPEVKPQVQDKVWDDYVLRYAAIKVFKEPLNGWTDDVADFFNHLPLAPSEYWTSCFVWNFSERQLPLAGFDANQRTPPVSIVSEKRLGFGLSLSPNVAQRFSDAIIGVFKQKFDAEEETRFESILNSASGVCTPYSSSDLLTMTPDGVTNVCRWIAERRRLSLLTGNNELRRYSVHMYTDDPIFSVIGQDTFIRAMRVWHEVTESFGLRMAIPRKRQVGPCLAWLGFQFYLPAGVVTVAPSKVNRALVFAQGILRGLPVAFDQYRRFIGLLEHMLLFVEGDRTYMYGLYGSKFRRGNLFGPSTTMHFGDFENQALRRWFEILMMRGGCFFSSVLPSQTIPIPTLPPTPFQTSTVFGNLPQHPQAISLFSDAFASTTEGGLGGYAHGSFWHTSPTDEPHAYHSMGIPCGRREHPYLRSTVRRS